MCYRVKFGSSTSQGVCINRTEPPKLGRAVAVRAWLTPENTLLHHLRYPAEFGRSISVGTSVIKEIRLKYSIPRVPPFKVTQGHRNRHRLIRHL